MSIATDEAEQWAQSRYVGSSHIERHDGRAVSVPDYPQKVSLRAEGYVVGRTAEPTEAEIEAADEALLQAYRDNSNMLTNREAVHIVLEAARKAVTGDE
ncbi:hypothetical protein BPY_23110 [Bifidobacterium psychraerophilum]|uniref:hypothetical protein n=1 Tax=Bifidobacterium psychraerophilum TaxID=218140 RepID=UPI00311562CC